MAIKHSNGLSEKQMLRTVIAKNANTKFTKTQKSFPENSTSKRKRNIHERLRERDKQIDGRIDGHAHTKLLKWQIKQNKTNERT